jgi:histone acetyltransferase 1
LLQATFEVPGFKEYHRRMQLFILLYIEAGSYINEEEEGWEFVVLCAISFIGSIAYYC